jgi:FkbM family methyltransferase
MKDDNFYIRHDQIDNVKQWWWIENENGLWTGPKQNWENSHKEKIEKHVKKRGTVVQAGGGCGMYPRLLSDMFERIYSFEMEPSNFQCLVRNVERKNVWCFNAALGDKMSFVSVKEGNRSNRGTHKVNLQDGPVPQMMIDTFPWRNVDFIWLDVEGYEENVLRGAKNTINKFRPIIFAEGGRTRCREFVESLNYEMADQSVSDTIFLPK